MGRLTASLLFNLLLLAVQLLIFLHLAVAPYTKVEESFHIQAIHDILSYGVPLPWNSARDAVSAHLQQHYDHFAFPGAVPRTFIGALALSGVSRGVSLLAPDDGRSDTQTLARAALGLFNASALISYASGVRRAFGQTTAIWYLLFQASQFHVLYYASRTLSNIFAFGLSTFALRALLPEPTLQPAACRKRCQFSLFLLTVAGIIFRSELALFLATHTLFLLATGRLCIRAVIPAGAVGVLVGLTATVTVDSFFWQRFPLWPEFTAFKFNVVSGQASAWGVQAWHFYFTNAIPRLMLNPCTYVLSIPIALGLPSTRSAAVYLLTPTLAFVVLFSSQPHKEWRFILYAVPPLTAAAALGASYVWTHRAKSLFYRVLSLVLLLSPLASFALSTFVLLPSSAANYPGAYALNALHTHHAGISHPKDSVTVYLGNLACQTGVTRFLEVPHLTTSTTWTYDKTENETTKSLPSFWTRFDYALIEASSSDESTLRSLAPEQRWETVKVIDGFAGVRIVRPGEESKGSVETDVIRRAGGDDVVGLWAQSRDFVRGRVTKGWWVELRMEPRVRIMRRVRLDSVS